LFIWTFINWFNCETPVGETTSCYARLQNCEKRLLASCPPVRPHGITRLPLDRFLLNLVSEYFANICPKFHENLTRVTGTVHEYQHIFMITSRSVLLRMRNSSDKRCRGNQSTHFMFNQSILANSAVYKMTRKNIVELDRLQMTIWRMRNVCWIPKATNTHSEYIIFIAFPLQQWLHERASMLCLYVYYLLCMPSIHN
jgi:hypothetical protein